MARKKDDTPNKGRQQRNRAQSDVAQQGGTRRQHQGDREESLSSQSEQESRGTRQSEMGSEIGRAPGSQQQQHRSGNIGRSDIPGSSPRDLDQDISGSDLDEDESDRLA